LAMIAAACGGDGGNETTTTEVAAPTTGAAETTTTPAGDDSTPEPSEPQRGISDDNVVQVGGWLAQSGPLAVVASIVNAVHLRFDMANQEGGINGYTFEFVDIDDQADPSQTVAAVRQLWEEDEVFGL